METFLGVAADVNNETGSIYYKLFKVCAGVLPRSACAAGVASRARSLKC